MSNAPGPPGPYVFDAAAILALLQNEPGATIVQDNLSEGVIGTVNMIEVLTRLQERGMPASVAEDMFAGLQLRTVPLDENHAREAARLRPLTRAAGLSLGDRACLALAASLARPAITSDRAWATIAAAANVPLILIR